MWAYTCSDAHVQLHTGARGEWQMHCFAAVHLISLRWVSPRAWSELGGQGALEIGHRYMQPCWMLVLLLLLLFYFVF